MDRPSPGRRVKPEHEALARAMVERYAPSRHLVVRVDQENLRLVWRELPAELGPLGAYEARLPLRVLMDVPADLAIPEHRGIMDRLRGIMDRLLGRHPGPLRRVGAVVRVPVDFQLEIEVRP